MCDKIKKTNGGCFGSVSAFQRFSDRVELTTYSFSYAPIYLSVEIMITKTMMYSRKRTQRIIQFFRPLYNSQNLVFVFNEFQRVCFLITILICAMVIFTLCWIVYSYAG